MNKGQALLKVLICDDDAQDRKLIRAYLRRDGEREIVALEAGETAEIQQALEKGRVDLVLLDVQMPDKSGMQWLKEIAERQLAPVVMLTGFGNEEIAVQSLEQGAVGYLSKRGLTHEKLVAAIEGAIRKWRGLQLSRANQEQLERMASVDPLTGLRNRRAAMDRLREALARARRYGDKLCLAILDIDHFKEINDSHGHLVGDDVLEKVASVLEKRLRDTDTAGRYGGDEFILILPDTDLPAALQAAERLRQALAAIRMRDARGHAFGLTVSLGLTGYRPCDDEASLIARADAALYSAKQNGRNRVETSGAQRVPCPRGGS